MLGERDGLRHSRGTQMQGVRVPKHGTESLSDRVSLVLMGAVHALEEGIKLGVLTHLGLRHKPAYLGGQGGPPGGVVHACIGTLPRQHPW